MRQLVTGVDADGQSCVVAEYVTESPAGDQMGMQSVFDTGSSPPSPRPPGLSQFMDLGVPVGVVRFMSLQWPPGSQAPMHFTDTVDVNTVVEGSIEILLGDGRHRLEPGDSVVVTGVDHGWEAGPSGATVAILLLGTPSPE